MLKKILDYFDLGLLPYRPQFGKSEVTLTQKSIKNLEYEGVPDKIIETLTPLIEKQFSTEDKLLASIEKLIGKEQVKTYSKVILNHANKTKEDQGKTRKRKKTQWTIFLYLSTSVGVFASYFINPLQMSKIDVTSISLSHLLYALATSAVIYPFVYKHAKFNVSSPNIMQVFISFQYGFFWKTIWDTVIRGLQGM